MKNANELLKKFPVFSSLLLTAFFFTNFFTIGKSLIILLIILIISNRSIFKYFDLNAILLFWFFVIYALVSEFNKEFKTGVSDSLIVMPLTLYVAGKWFVSRVNNSVQFTLIFIALGFSLGSIALFAIYNNLLISGFEDGSRNIAVGVSSQETSATVLGGTLIVLISVGGMIFTKSNKLSVMQRFAISILFVISLFAAIRLGSRTLLGVGAISLLMGFFANVQRNRMMQNIAFIVIILIALYIISIYVSGFVDINFYFRDRIDSEEHGFASAGGRLDRWLSAIGLLITHPIGWGINLIGYSHNFWLDVARNGGWPSFIFSIVITIMFFFNLNLALEKNKDDKIFYTFAICMSAGFMLLFSVEPILDGFTYVFAMFCFFFGCINAYCKKSFD